MTVCACSFCGRRKPQVKVLVQGRAGFICDECVVRVDRPDAHVAYCAYCLADDGKHALDCQELSA